VCPLNVTSRTCSKSQSHPRQTCIACIGAVDRSTWSIRTRNSNHNVDFDDGRTDKVHMDRMDRFRVAGHAGQRRPLVGPWTGVRKIYALIEAPQPDLVASLRAAEARQARRCRTHPTSRRQHWKEMRQAPPWLRVRCRNEQCMHHAPMAIAPLIIRWGADASSNRLRANARCVKCRMRGGDLKH
jgi:hypothetical protein